MLPKTRKWLTLAFISLHTSWRVSSFTLDVGDLLDKYTAQEITSAQNSLGMLLAFNILLVILRIVLFFLSVPLFYCGDPEIVKERRTPLDSQKS